MKREGKEGRKEKGGKLRLRIPKSAGHWRTGGKKSRGGKKGGGGKEERGKGNGPLLYRSRNSPKETPRAKKGRNGGSGYVHFICLNRQGGGGRGKRGFRGGCRGRRKKKRKGREGRKKKADKFS